MPKKPPRKPRIVRRGELLDPTSTQIRMEQSEKLKKPRQPTLRIATEDEPVKLISKDPTFLYTSGKTRLQCDHCDRTNPTKRMFVYEQSSHGKVTLCETCDEEAEVRSFYKLDAMDSRRSRKQYKVDEME
jgi:hypothetical protein